MKALKELSGLNKRELDTALLLLLLTREALLVVRRDGVGELSKWRSGRWVLACRAEGVYVWF